MAGKGNKKAESCGPAAKKRKTTVVAPIITGDALLWLKRWYPLAIYCCLLIFFYISHHFYHQRLQREEIASRLELNEERSRAVVFSSIRENNSRPSYILREVKARGLDLEESTVPPKKLTIYEQQ